MSLTLIGFLRVNCRIISSARNEMRNRRHCNWDGYHQTYQIRTPSTMHGPSSIYNVYGMYPDLECFAISVQCEWVETPYCTVTTFCTWFFKFIKVVIANWSMPSPGETSTLLASPWTFWDMIFVTRSRMASLQIDICLYWAIFALESRWERINATLIV